MLTKNYFNQNIIVRMMININHSNLEKENVRHFINSKYAYKPLVFAKYAKFDGHYTGKIVYR